MPRLAFMRYFQLKNHTQKILLLVAASLILPGLAFAGADKGKGNDGQNNRNQNGWCKPSVPHISAVPEANTGIVLIPFVGAILLFSSLQLARLQTQKNRSLSK